MALANRGEEKPRCTSCGGKINKKCGKCNSHHTRPRSRGGDDGIPNEIHRNKEEHSAWHELNINLRAGEVARLVLFDWETYNPHREKKEKFTFLDRLDNRTQSWDFLYGLNATKRSVMFIVITKFTRLNADRVHIRRVLKLAMFAKKISKKDYSYLIKLINDKVQK